MGISYGSITVTDITDITDVYLQYGLALANATVTNSYAFNGTGEVGWNTTYPTWVSGYQIWIREVTVKEGIVSPEYGTPYLDKAVNQINTNYVNLNNKLKTFFYPGDINHNYSGAFAVSKTENDGLNTANADTYGFNTRVATGLISMGYNKIPLLEMGLFETGTPANGIKLYSPILTNGVITNHRLDATLSTDGLKLLNGGIVAGDYAAGQNGYIYLSTENGPRISINGFIPGTGQNDPQWRAIIGTNFGVLSDGSLYASNVIVGGEITATTGSISGSVTIGGTKTATTVLNDITDAATTASNYFTDISGGGVYVHSSDTPSSSSAENAKGVKITDQIDIIRNGESVAEFGALARIGKENESSIKCLPNGIIGIGNGASEYFNFSDSGSSVTTSRRYMLGRTTTDNMHRFPILADGPLSFNLTYHNIANSFTILITILIPYSDSLYDNLRVEFDYTFTYGTGTTSTLNKTVSYEYNGSTESRTIYITYDGSVTLSNIYIDSPINSLYPDSEQYYVELLYAETAMSPSFSIGGNNAANGAYSCAIGCDNTIGNLTSLLSGDYSVAEGQNNKVNAKWSHAEGYNNKIVPPSGGTPIWGAHAEGRGNEVKYSYGHAEGYNTESNGNSAHSEGNGTYAYGNAAHAEGYQTKAQANSAHAEGFYTQATAGYAHAEGYYSIASGQCSHAEGYQTKAIGFRSHASGLGTEANLDDQTVIGRYNELDPGDGMYPLGSKYAFIVGNGVDDGDDITRSNALTVDWDGNITINNHSSPIGTTETHIPNAISCASGKYYQVAYLTLDPGTWIISGSARFQQSNTTGIRRVLFTNDTSNYNNVTTQPGSLGNIWYQTFNGSAFPASGVADVKTTSAPINVTTENPTIRLIAYQSSGSAMDVTGRFYAVRIK